MGISNEDRNEIEILVNQKIVEIMDGLLDEFGRFIDDVPARQIVEAIKNRAEKEAARLKEQAQQTD